MKKLIQTLAVAAALATAGAAAMAQADGMMGHDGMHHGDMARMAQKHAQHLADLKAKLKITSAQETPWNAFADSMKPPADMQGKRPDRAELDKLSTPERIDKMSAMRKEHMALMEAAMDKRADATKALYAALSPEQKKVFDAEFAKMGRHGEHGRAHEQGHDMPAPAAKP